MCCLPLPAHPLRQTFGACVPRVRRRRRIPALTWFFHHADSPASALTHHMEIAASRNNNRPMTNSCFALPYYDTTNSTIWRTPTHRNLLKYYRTVQSTSENNTAQRSRPASTCKIGGEEAAWKEDWRGPLYYCMHPAGRGAQGAHGAHLIGSATHMHTCCEIDFTARCSLAGWRCWDFLRSNWNPLH